MGNFQVEEKILKYALRQVPDVEGEVSAKRKFKVYPIGYFHTDIAEVRTAEGKLYMFVAIDRTSKFAFVELHEKATTRTAADFLFAPIKAVPYKIHTVLTDKGTHFTDPGGETWTPSEITQSWRKGGVSERMHSNSAAPAPISTIG